MGDFTDSGVLVRLAYQAMQDLGIDAAVVLQRIGLKHEQLDEKDLRTPHSAQNLFWT
ncbi:MAG TPA: AraC family transcriptional regulator, partial [Gammaproteobacteria bacterium]|nr:AraC family transcriptional regulator [Gammaproteobacteria bacterium]